MMTFFKQYISRFIVIYLLYVGARLILGLFKESTSPEPLYVEALIFSIVVSTLSILFSKPKKENEA